ncbi:15146_t:CDS:2 [Funneliformis geosporum]|uniref:15146_t:CDS:1 n=1 Tax=Funneliformis geosporum TaxID=1117311 RepID=A0A9W4SMF5_9GLOM|nr:15146_t:CDS:2 [Funneliformis geosporum]
MRSYEISFLNECELEPYETKIDTCIKQLKQIIECDCEQDDRKKSVQILFDKYQKATTKMVLALLELTVAKGFLPIQHCTTGAQAPQPDRKKAREWEEKRSRRQININRPTIAGINGIINGNINGGIFTGLSERTTLKRDREKDYDIVTKRTKIDDENVQWPCIQAHIPPLRVVSPPNSYLCSTQQELINHISKCFTSSIPAVGAKRNEH